MEGFVAGDLVVYKQTGVCRVEEVAPSKLMPGKELYYTLKPVYAQGMVYVPVSTKAYLKKVMDNAEAEEWIAKIPDIAAEICTDRRLAVQKEFYSQKIAGHNFMEIIGILKGLLHKAKRNSPGKKSLTSTEEMFLKQAEDLIYQELAEALGKDIQLIKRNIEAMI